MKADLALVGILGLLCGALIYVAAQWARQFVPDVLGGVVFAWIIFAMLLLISLAEMPLMLLALRRMAQTKTHRWILLGTYAFYVSFAFVYAALFVLVIGDNVLGNVLAALGVVRFVSGIFVGRGPLHRSQGRV